MSFELRVFCMAAALAGCVWETDLPEEAKAIPIEPSRSLLITENLPEITLEEALGGRTSAWRDYRLLAIVNRTDLSDEPDRAAEGGEGRLVFGHATEARTVIVEYAQPGPARDWAARWQALDGRASSLLSLIDDFGPIAHVRTAEAARGPIVFHQYVVTADAVVESPLFDGPSLAPAPIATETCSGCHAKTSTGFQLDPQTGRAAEFLSNPGASSDELRRRATWMRLALRR